MIIERPHKKCRVTIHTARPGVIIGKKGADIETLRKKLTVFTKSELHLNIVEVRKPEVDAIKSNFMRFLVTNKVDLQNIRDCTHIGFGTFVLPGNIVCFVLFVPLYVRGRHWGTLGTGIVPQALGVN